MVAELRVISSEGQEHPGKTEDSEDILGRPHRPANAAPFSKHRSARAWYIRPNGKGMAEMEYVSDYARSRKC